MMYFKNFFGKFFKNILLFCLLFNTKYFNFYFFKFFFNINYFFKKTTLYKSLKNSLNISFKEFFLIRKKKRFKIKKRIKKKLRFYYNFYDKKNKIYKLKVKMFNSNFFITLTDYNNNVLLSRSTGQVAENRKKKVKLSPYLVTKMMYPILIKLKKKKN